MGEYKNLEVWQLARDLAVEIYKYTRNDRIQRDFGFKDQLQRSAVSIASNIAEGDESGTPKAAIKYFYIAKASLAELETQIIIGKEIEYLTENESNQLLESTDKISSKLRKLIQYRESKLS